MLGTPSPNERPGAPELADRCREIRERLTAIAESLATLRAELDDALEAGDEASETG